MNWLVKWGVKKYALKVVNDALAAYNVNIDRSRAIVARYSAKLKSAIAFLESLDAKLADGKLTESEADAITAEAKTLAKEMTA